MARTYLGAHSSCGWLWAVCLLVLSATMEVVADSTSNNPDIDPKLDPRNPLKYITNNVLTTIGLGEQLRSIAPIIALMNANIFRSVAVLTLIVAITQTYLIIKTKTKYMLVLIIAECCKLLPPTFTSITHSFTRDYDQATQSA